MTTQPNPDKMSAAELRAALAAITSRLDSIEAQFAAMGQGLRTAASSAPTYQDFDADTILMTFDDNGKASYKVKGVPFKKFGVRVWDEILPELGIDPAQLKPGPNPIKVRVRALMTEATNTETGAVTMQPKKIIGKA